VRSVRDVTETARRNPQDWSMTTSSLGAAGHLAAIAFNQAAGNVGLMFDPVLAPLPMVQSAQLRALGMTNEMRNAAVPTMDELGLPNFVFHSWYGVWGFRGIPAEIVTRMNAALNEGSPNPTSPRS